MPFHSLAFSPFHKNSQTSTDRNNLLLIKMFYSIVFKFKRIISSGLASSFSNSKFMKINKILLKNELNKNFEKNWGAINCAECAAIRVITVNMINDTINEIKIASPRMQMIGIRQTFLTFEFFFSKCLA